MPPTLESILADPPAVHAAAPAGVWATDEDCYRFLARVLQPQMTTLETGLGVSTAVFVAFGGRHTSVFLEPEEGERFLEYARRKGLSSDGLTLRAGYSDAILPGLGTEELDVVLLDGCHAFPFPQLDWFYAAGRLRRGGIVVVDDLRLPAPSQLVNFLHADPRWELLERTEKWGAFRRLSSGALREEWRSQPFFGTFDYDARALAGRIRRRARHVARRLRVRT